MTDAEAGGERVDVESRNGEGMKEEAEDVEL